jgi:hypothetical protein
LLSSQPAIGRLHRTIACAELYPETLRVLHNEPRCVDDTVEADGFLGKRIYCGRISNQPALDLGLNPVENIWQFMRDSWLSNRIFTSHENIIDLCCEAWNRLIDQPWRIAIGRRKWARAL